MDEQQMKEQILQAIQDVYKVKYIGKIKVSKLQSGWSVKLYFYNSVLISAELPDDKFISYFKQELRDRNLDCSNWYKGIMILPEYSQIDSSCC